MKTFEEKLKRLETIAEAIRVAGLGLKEATALFEEGIQLSKELETELTAAERKIEILVNNPEGPGDEAEFASFEEEGED